MVHCDRVLLSIIGHKGEFDPMHCSGVVLINGTGTTAMNGIYVCLELGLLSSHASIISTMAPRSNVDYAALDAELVTWYNSYMTNMTRREYRQNQEFRGNVPEDEIPFGSHYANALAFIVDALADDETPVFNTNDLENQLSHEDLMEWAEMYNFTEEMFKTALKLFRAALDNEVHNAFYNGDCNNCTPTPKQFN